MESTLGKNLIQARRKYHEIFTCSVPFRRYNLVDSSLFLHRIANENTQVHCTITGNKTSRDSIRRLFGFYRAHKARQKLEFLIETPSKMTTERCLSCPNDTCILPIVTSIAIYRYRESTRSSRHVCKHAVSRLFRMRSCRFLGIDPLVGIDPAGCPCCHLIKRTRNKNESASTLAPASISFGRNYTAVSRFNFRSCLCK